MLTNILRSARAQVVRQIKPKDKYWFATKSLKPLSHKFGFDRGTPIDRYWIEKFLKENRKYIKGVCLEISDNRYTRAFGEKSVTKSDILDINKKNKRANIHGDLRNLSKVISDNTYNTIILTHVLGQIDDFYAAISECKRILKPRGSLLGTSSCLSPTFDIKNNYWRFTTSSFKYIFSKYFKSIYVKSYGNVLAGQYFWVGLAQEEIPRKTLEYHDPNFPCIVAIRATKTGRGRKLA